MPKTDENDLRTPHDTLIGSLEHVDDFEAVMVIGVLKKEVKTIDGNCVYRINHSSLEYRDILWLLRMVEQWLFDPES